MDLPIAVQLYTLRHADLPVDALLTRVAEAGYAGVETAGHFDLDAAALAEKLARHRLEVVSSHIPIDRLRDDLDGVVAFERALGNTTLVAPWLAEPERPEEAGGWRELGRELGDIGRRCRERGATLLYHNHDFEMVTLDGRTALEWLFDGAGDDLDLELDLAWVVRGGADAFALLRRFAGRCPRVHLKDLRPSAEAGVEGGFADVGAGTLDWERLLPAAAAAGAQWFIVEHDHPTNPMASIRHSAEYLRDLAERLAG